MKLLIVLQTPPPVGGACQMNQNVINILNKNRVNYIHIIPRFIRFEKDRGKFDYYKIYRLIKVLVEITKTIICEKIDYAIMELSSTRSSYIKDFILSTPLLLVKKKIFYFLHMSNLVEFYSSLSYLEKIMFKLIQNDRNVFFVLSKKLKISFSSVLRKEQMLVLENGINEPTLKIDWKKDNKKIICLHLSILMKEKGYRTVLEVAKLMKNYNFHFIIAGPNGPNFNEREFNDFLEVEGIAENVTHIGKVEGIEKEKLFAKSDIFLFPSTFKIEAFPLVILEALAYGLLIISNNTGAISEILENNINGFLLDDINAERICEKLMSIKTDTNKLNSIKINNIMKFKSLYTLEIYEKKLMKYLM